MLVTVKKANSSLQKGLLTFNKISTFGWMLVTVCKTEFTSWKTLITFTCTLDNIHMHTYMSAYFCFYYFSEAHGMLHFRTWSFTLQWILIRIYATYHDKTKRYFKVRIFKVGISPLTGKRVKDDDILQLKNIFYSAITHLILKISQLLLCNNNNHKVPLTESILSSFE